jgi:hypothetical protein
MSISALSGEPLPGRGLTWLGSAAIVVHLFAVVTGLLAAPSGPWPSPEGPTIATPPQFAFSAQEEGGRAYLQAVGLRHDFHFSSNRPGGSRAYLEVRLADAAGRDLGTLTLPDPAANPWLRFQQSLLVQWLADDQPVAPNFTEFIAAPGRSAPTTEIWDPKSREEPRQMRLRTIAEHLIPRDRPVFRPSPWAALLAKSYARHLCRAHGAASARLIRHSRDPLPPLVLFTDTIPADATAELVADFGEVGP